MRNRIHFALLASLIIILYQCGQKEDRGTLHREADSLLGRVMDLQQKLGSPEIQRLHDFEHEINEDISYLAGLGEQDSSMVRYMDLYNSLGQCMDACNQFHEEAFLLETSLRDILDLAGHEESDRQELRQDLDFEQNIYRDLAVRVDSSLEIVLKKAEQYYSLKPEIESLKKLREEENKGD